MRKGEARGLLEEEFIFLKSNRGRSAKLESIQDPLKMALLAKMSSSYLVLLLLLSYSEASTNDRNILFQNHGGTLPDLPEFSNKIQNGEIEITKQQTRNREIENLQWRIPKIANDSPTTSSILRNEITTSGWLKTHANWVKPVSCEEVNVRPGKSGHDANLIFGSLHDFNGGHDSSIIIHPVCIPNNIIEDDANIVENDMINLHGKKCGPAQCIKNDELKYESGQCKKALITESDLPGPHYISDLNMRGIANVIAKDTVGIAQFNPSGSSKGKDDKDTTSLLGYTKVCHLLKGNKPYILTNPLNGYKYTRTNMRIKGTIHGVDAKVTSSEKDGNDINNDCSFSKIKYLPNALVEIWQSDSYGRYDKEPITPLAQAYLDKGILSNITDNLTLPSGSCRGILRTGLNGHYIAETEVPGNTGPPQSIHFRVSSPGYKTLNTVTL